MATLDDYPSVRTATFVKIDVDYYWTGSGYAFEALTFSDHMTDYEFNGDTYTALGKLMSVSTTASEISASSGGVTILLSGIPNSSIEEIVKSKLKGAPVEIYRAFFNQDNVLLTTLDIDNPLKRYVGYINNYSLTEEWDFENKFASNSIAIDLGSNVDVIQRKIAGRKTNERSMRRHFGDDDTFDRVGSLVNANIRFGR